MIENLLANPFAGDGTLHPDLHLIFVDEVCGLFKLAGILDDVVKRKVSWNCQGRCPSVRT